MAKNINPIKVVQDYAHGLGQKLRLKRVILFGSAARNQMTYDSDLDVIVLSPDFENLDFIKRLQLLSRSRQGEARKIPMDILGYTEEEFAQMAKESVVLEEAEREGKEIKYSR